MFYKYIISFYYYIQIKKYAHGFQTLLSCLEIVKQKTKMNKNESIYEKLRKTKRKQTSKEKQKEEDEV